MAHFTNTLHTISGTSAMDSFFYIVTFSVFFGLIAIMLIVRRTLNKRLEAIEKKIRVEEEARQMAETNSGL
jgi:hypothetical protein